jgi:hypothetical protein
MCAVVHSSRPIRAARAAMPPSSDRTRCLLHACTCAMIVRRCCGGQAARGSFSSQPNPNITGLQRSQRRGLCTSPNQCVHTACRTARACFCRRRVALARLPQCCALAACPSCSAAAEVTAQERGGAHQHNMNALCRATQTQSCACAAAPAGHWPACLPACLAPPPSMPLLIRGGCWGFW